MKNTILLIVTLVLIAFNTSLKAQDTDIDKKMGAAITSYKNLKYTQTIELLKPVLAKDSNNTNAMDMMANCYRLTKQYPETLKWYEKLSKRSFLKPNWALHYAEALANNKQYEKSELWYRKYLSIIPSDRRANLFAQADFDKLGREANWEIKYLSINTSASDYAPMIYKDGLVFSSNRASDRAVKYVFGWNNTPFSDLYEVKDRIDIIEKEINSDSLVNLISSKNLDIINDDNTSRTSNDTEIIGSFDPKIFLSTSSDNKRNKVEMMNKKINSKYHEGTSAIFPDGSFIFTRNNYNNWKSAQSSDGVTKLKLYTASGFNLKKIKPFPYNNDEYSVGHPTISKDGKIIIFASDMPGGLGGVDLYFCIRLSSESPWSRPVNFGGKVNTEGNEEFPYLDNFNKLYFSSTGWPGLGGLDIFTVELDDLKPASIPKNLGPPLNSPYDDFSVAKYDDKNGYFSSNRKGDDDIYSFKEKTFKILLKGKVVDGITNEPLNNALVTLRNGDIQDPLKLNARGEFEQPLVTGTGYELNGSLLNFLPDRRYLATDGINKDTTIFVELSLKRSSKIQQYVIQNCDSLKSVFNTGNIYYDLDKYYIRQDAHENLDKVVSLMKKYPAISIISRSHCDSRASESYNRTLSLNRGEAAKSYLVSKGVDRSRINVEYYGKSKLVNRCVDGVECSEAEQQLNRRTEFEVIYNGINLSLIDCK